MTDPLTHIEDQKGQHDLGAIAYRLYTGARSEGASRLDAALCVYAWFRASIDGAAEA